jgi:large exoprotein involved in heme utilization and adhesion
VTVRGDKNKNSFAVVSTGSNTPEDAIVAGSGGNLTIETSLLELRDGGQVTTSVQGPGNAGQLAVFADRVEISGVEISGVAGSNESGLFSQSISQSLGPPPEGAEPGDRGRGGNIFVDADRLELTSGGRISAETSGPGDGGNIEIHAGREIYLSSSEISALSRGDGAAGEVRIIAGKKLTLVGGSRLTTEAKKASGGKITVEAGQLVYLVDSQITTEVLLGSDNGGDILIDPDFVVLDGASVIASADSGDGGAITIIAGHLFPSADTIINASSRRGGIDGTIVVEPPETEVIGQLTTLETSLVDASSLLTTPCAARTAPSGSFVVSSRTSLAASPDSPLSWLGVAGLDGLTPAGPECRAQATQ